MKHIRLFAPLLVLALLLTACPTQPEVPAKSTDKDLTSVKFEAAKNGWATGQADVELVKTPIAPTAYTCPDLPAGTPINALIPTFIVSALATVTCDGAAVTSGVTAINFAAANTKTFVITAEDGTTKNYTLKVNPAELAISVFKISDDANILTYPVIDLSTNIDNTTSPATITGVVPFSFDLTKLRADFTSNGTSVEVLGAAQTSGTTVVDFTNPVTYTVIGVNANKTYTVTITKAPVSTDSGIASFSIGTGSAAVVATVDNTAHTITASLKAYTSLTPVINFTMNNVMGTLFDTATTPAKQVSGTNTLNFASVLTATLTAKAEDGSSVPYTVTVTYEVPAATVIGFDPDSSTDGMKYVDIKINNRVAAAVCKVGVLYSSYDTSFISTNAEDTFSSLPFWASLVDGDVIRIWDKSTSTTAIVNDVSKTDNTTNRWDYVNPAWITGTTGGYTSFLSSKYNVIYISDATGFIGLTPYMTSGNDGSWISAANVSAINLASATALGYWSNDITAYTSAATTVKAAALAHTLASGKAVQLNTGLNIGLKASDWNTAASAPNISFGVTSATSTLNTDVGGSAVFSVEAIGNSSAAPTKVSADFTLIGGASDVSFTLTQVGTTTTYIATSTQSIAANALVAGNYTIPVIAWSAGSATVNGAMNRTNVILTILPKKEVTIDSVFITPAVIAATGSSDITVTANVTTKYGATIDSVTADLTGIGGSVETLTLTGLKYVKVISIDPTDASGTFSIPITVNATGLTPVTANASVEVTTDPKVIVYSPVLSVSSGMAGTATPFTVTASAAVLNGASAITSVTADLSAFTTGSATFDMPFVSGTTYTSAAFTTDIAQAGGTYPITITAKNGDNVIGTSVVNFKIIPLAFPGSDFETNPVTTTLMTANPKASYELVVDHNGDSKKALLVKGTPSGNSTVFLTTNAGTAKGVYTKVTFWFKTNAACTKDIHIEFGNATSNVAIGQLFTLSSVGTVSPAPLTPNTVIGSFAYSATTTNTQGTWVKITLDITNTDTAKQFLIRVGKSVAYDFYIDEIVFE